MSKLTAITVQPPNAESLRPHSEVLAEYTSPDSRKLVLNSDEDLQLATDIINDIKTRAAQVEALRVSVTQPINQGLRAFNAFFKPFADSAEAAREMWDEKIRVFLAARETTRRAAEVALQQAITTQDAPAATAAIQAMQPAPRASGLAVQDAWDFEEKNHDIVPTSLTVLDRRLVATEIKRQIEETRVAAGGTLPANWEPAIPGLKVFKRQIVKATG